jgi:transaldolase
MVLKGPFKAYSQSSDPWLSKRTYSNFLRFIQEPNFDKAFRKSTKEVVKFLAQNGIKVNVTALMTVEQVEEVAEVLSPEVPSCVSVFAGRIADTGRDPIPIMKNCVKILESNLNSELIWASPRELLNVFQANDIGCQIITATNDILKKLELVGRDLLGYSQETVTMFYEDALKSNFRID